MTIQRRSGPDGVKLSDFQFWATLDVSSDQLHKSMSGLSEDPRAKKFKGKGLLPFRGVASTNSRDFQGERVLPGAIDWNYFLKRGWIIDGHGTETNRGIGFPTKVTPDVDLGNGLIGTIIEGFILPTKRGKEVYELAKAVSGTPRDLGLSVQGPIVKRSDSDKRDVVKAVVMDVAVDRHPVNPNSYLEALEKSLAYLQKSLDVGDPTLSYAGKTEGSSLIPQSLQGAKAMGNKKKGTWNLTPEEEEKLLKGIEEDEEEEDEEEEDEEDEEDEDELEKGLSTVMSQVRDTLTKGGSIRFFDADPAAASPDLENLVNSLNDFTEVMTERLDTLSKALMANGKLSQSLAERMSGIEDALDDTSDELSKALRVSTGRKSVVAADRLMHPLERRESDPSGVVLPSQAKDELRKGFAGATDPAVKAQIGRAMLLADGGQTFSRANLDKILGK